MKKIMSIAAIAIVLLAGSARAATLDITLGPSITYSFNASQSLTPSNIPLIPQPAGINLINNSVINPSGLSNGPFYTSPTGLTTPGYLAVLGLAPNLKTPDTGEALFTFSGAFDMLGFTWGTVDHFNTLTLKDGSNTYVITGANILGNVPGTIDGKSQIDVEFTDTLGNILSADFKSTSNTFEAGNFSQTSSSTPLPASFLMFGTGLALLVFFARRRTAKA